MCFKPWSSYSLNFRLLVALGALNSFDLSISCSLPFNLMGPLNCKGSSSSSSYIESWNSPLSFPLLEENLFSNLSHLKILYHQIPSYYIITHSFQSHYSSIHLNMITYTGKGKVEKTILEQATANTAPPARVSPKLEVLAQARELPSLRHAFLAQARAR